MCVLVSGHEAIFEGSEIEGALSRRRRHTHGAGRKDLLGIGAHHKTLAKEASGDGGCRAESDPWQAPKERSDTQRVAAKEHLEKNDDLTLEEHREAFEEEFGEAVSTSTIGRAIARLPDGGWPLKKSPR
jgi:transposase